jgi:hypothetical protein
MHRIQAASMLPGWSRQPSTAVSQCLVDFEAVRLPDDQQMICQRQGVIGLTEVSYSPVEVPCQSRLYASETGAYMGAIESSIENLTAEHAALTEKLELIDQQNRVERPTVVAQIGQLAKALGNLCTGMSLNRGVTCWIVLWG